ncbi:MAG: hypothetical protein V3W41_07735 [Planctomycetota bacterium]
MAIPIGIEGAILNSKHRGHRVVVEGDERSGGYHVVHWWEGSRGLGALGAFDNWVETKGDLELYFEEAGWQMSWESTN